MTIAHLEPRPASPPVAANNILAVASGKGGVGKTWFSITLTHALALSGKKALLFDGDLGLANVDVQLGVTPRRDLGNVLAGQTTLSQATVPYAAGGFDIIAGRSGSGSLASLPAGRLNDLRTNLHTLATHYDYVIMDMGAGIDRTVRMLASHARTALVITTDEPTAITDAYAYIKVTTLERPNADIRVVVNLAASASDGLRTFGIIEKACKQFLQIEPIFAGAVRRDPHVRESIRKQTSILTRYPSSEAADDVQAIAARLRGGY